ncbi:hypothetical protein FEM03_10820 [Phragmitibacter flavus]|uniref:Uncharacterized protein n=2 Tax=Phragmitibacter flavus TaxID=2576071 RepID=A0A5R8KER2_9BACT|nr:hypothetical protein FEM03_10820 [Phragmitibacter flavus]
MQRSKQTFIPKMTSFSPKSTKYLQVGHFWMIPIDDRRCACGVVLALVKNGDGKLDSRSFLAGLVDWTGRTVPDEDSIQGRRIVVERFTHIKTIQMSGGEVIGKVEPWWDRSSEISKDDSIPSAGYNVLTILAKKLAST